MSQQQPQQQHNKQQQPQEWKPNAATVFLIQSDDETFVARARRHVQRKYGQGTRDSNGNAKLWHMVTELNPEWLKQQNQIVVLHCDPDRGIQDPKTGEWRDRDRGLKQRGEWIRDPEPPEVLETKPIDMSGKTSDGRPFWVEEGYSETVNRLALCTEITSRVHPCRAQLDIREPAEGSSDYRYSISVRAT